MAQRADTVFLLTNTWGSHRVVSSKRDMNMDEWRASSNGKRWIAAVKEAKEKYAEENRQRKEAGQPPRVISNGSWGLVAAYCPGAPRPPSGATGFYHFTPDDFQEAFELTRARHAPN